jgi:hypothetical protein
VPKGNGGAEDRAKVKLRVIEFELEGANSSVESSIRQLTSALSIRSNGGTPKPLPPRPQPALAASEDEIEPVEAPDVESAQDSEAFAAAPARAPIARKPSPTPDPIEVDLTSGDMPFKRFCDERGITAGAADSKKYLVSAFWIKEYRQCSTIEAGQIYSVFKMMKWNLPADITGPLRAMKKQKWFTTPEAGKFAINHLGENEVKALVSQ